jgi:predicted lipoprotein with Yx(FWY)xxD motif
MRWPLVLVAGASLLGSACGSSSSKASTSSSTAGPTAPSTSASSASTASTPAAGSDATVTISAAPVPGLGTVLVNGNGRTLYLLSSEKGGKVTCTAANTCTTYWPPASLPAGMSKGIPGSGVQASLLGTATSPTGTRVVTYGGWPLYTFAGDSAAGAATGQGKVSFGGTWWVVSPTGAPITKPATSSPASSTPTTSSYGGY